MKKLSSSFISGHRIVGTKYEHRNRRGTIVSLPKTKILVRWNGCDYNEIVPRASIRREHLDDFDPDNDDDQETQDTENDSEDIDVRKNDLSYEESITSSKDCAEMTEGIEDDPNEDVQETQELSPTNSPPIVSASNARSKGPIEKGHRGRGDRRGHNSGSGSGAIGQPGAFFVPPLPSSNLHALVRKGTATSDPIYREWKEVDNVEIDLQTGFPHYTGHTQFNWCDPGVDIFPPDLDVPAIKSPLQYFMLMFPMQYLNRIVECTNIALDKHRRGDPVTKGEIMKYFGLRLAITLNPSMGGDGLDAYWQTVSADMESVINENYDFGSKYGMSKSRFMAISDCLQLETFVGSSAGENGYNNIEAFIDAFNERRKLVVNPGKFIIVDECMSFWKGTESRVSHESFIHDAHIPRKAVNQGVEFKASADGESSIMLFLEIQKGQNAPKQRFETDPEKLPIHCAAPLRTVSNWFGSGRVVLADAAFASVTTCVELLKRGLYFIGSIKTATEGYPVKFSEDFRATKPAINSHKVIITKDVDALGIERTIMSVLYALKPDLVQHIISSYSSSLLGDEKRIARSMLKERSDEGIFVFERDTEIVRRPKVIDEGSRYFAAIDLHDRYRQDYLQLERSWNTQRVWVRVFTTLLGVCFTDAYCAYCVEREQAIIYDDHENEKLLFKKFLSKLAHQLIFNTMDGVISLPAPLPQQGATNSLCRGLVKLAPLNKTHYVLSKYDLSTESGKQALRTYQLRCSTCNKDTPSGENHPGRRNFKTSYYCTGCSDPSIGQFVCVCSERTGRTCWERHLQLHHPLLNQMYL